MKKKKILFISYDGMTDPLGQSQVIPYLAGLSKHRYEFTILSCDKPDLYKKNKNYVEELIKPHNIQWVSLPYHKTPAVLSSFYDLYQLKKTVKKLQKKEKFDMVHTRPGLPTLVALWMKKNYGIKFLNDIRGFWADERADGGMWNLKNPLYKRIYLFFKKHEYECLEKADYNVCLTHKAKGEMHNWKNISNQPVPIEVVPCSADLELFDAEKIDKELKNELKAELNICDDDFIVSYLGSIDGWYLTGEMLQFCKALLNKIPKTKFLFISPHRHDIIATIALRYNIPPEKIIVRKARRHEVPALLSFSNYSIFFIKPCYSKISSSPTKHGEIMAMGIPVITNSGVGDVTEIVKKYNSGIILPSLIEAEYNTAAHKISDNIEFNKDEIRAGAVDFYDLQTAVKKYLEVYKSILSS